ncbi:uncharacterized protein LOC114881317 [Osmia bicornis bicornis]|uniref:uncharacterized protein LOC114881317 n=1 Tax=Osmia bicornis bicornis TaxID=1437191 RepID=UPI001EAE8BB9|nr:uncharacterized protein LOC114881317 [Osmia bicornis bicornis]
MSIELKSLTKQRANVKAQITRINNSVRKTEKLEIPFLELRKLKLEDYYNNFSSIQDQIEEKDDSSDQANIREEFEILYYECADFISSTLYQLSNREPSKASNTTNASSPSGPVSQSIFPKIHIKQFNGDYAEWQGVYDTFRSLVHDNASIPVTHKFHLLKSYLTGTAASVTNSLTASEENYSVAWELVQKCFNKPRKIIQSHVRALFELPDVAKDTPSSLRTVAEGAQMHVNALRVLNASIDCDELLIYILTAKLNKHTRTAWERSIEDDEMPTFKDLLSFLNKYSRDDEPVQLVTHNQNIGQRKRVEGRDIKVKPRANTFVSTRTLSCPLCKQNHYVNQCPNLLNQTPRERLKLVKSANLCINCLRDNHATPQCRSSMCQKCNGKHHTLLHFLDNVAVTIDQATSSSANRNVIPSVALASCGNSEILLATACIKILDKDNQEHECRILLDPGSQSNFITERLANSLRLPKTKMHIPVPGLAQQVNQVNYSVRAQIKSRVTEFSCEANFLTLPVITNQLPSRSVNVNNLQIPDTVQLADPNFQKPADIDALLGEYLFYRLLRAGQIRLKNRTAVLQETQLGWIVSGEVGINSKTKPTTNCFVTTTQLDFQIAKFWELEEYPHKQILSAAEKLCETIFKQTLDRDPTGRYIVRLPFNEKKSQLGESHAIALRRFLALERRLQSNVESLQQYSTFLEEYEKLNHMTDITKTANTEQGYYLPHHAVIKNSSLTTKVRVVFDGSAKSSTGISLNDTLMVGRTIQEDIF